MGLYRQFSARGAEPLCLLKCEYFLPSIVSSLIDEGKAQVRMLHSADKWYGVTYKEDKPEVVAAIARMTAEGLYPAEF